MAVFQGQLYLGDGGDSMCGDAETIDLRASADGQTWRRTVREPKRASI